MIIANMTNNIKSSVRDYKYIIKMFSDQRIEGSKKSGE